MMNTNAFENEIGDAARQDDDVRLAEAIYAYFLSIENVEFLPWKKLKSFFVAARSKDSETWKELSEEETKAVDNILTWTGHSANTIAVILRTYERATSELKQAQREGRISRYPSESISRLYKGTLQDLQPRLLEMYFKFGITNEELKNLVQELQRTVSQDEQEEILARYTPTPPAISMRSLLTEAQPDEPLNDDEPIYLFTEMKSSDLRQLSDDELWKLKGTTETAIQQAVPVLKKSLEHIKQELRKRL